MSRRDVRRRVTAMSTTVFHIVAVLPNFGQAHAAVEPIEDYQRGDGEHDDRVHWGRPAVIDGALLHAFEGVEEEHGNVGDQ